jgi:hypothetical protein
MELKLTAKNATEQRVLKYLQDNASEALAEKINAGFKSISGALDYAKNRAKELAHGGGCVCVEDDTVFGWIIHYFEEGEIKEKEKKPAFTAPSGVSVRKEQEVKKAAKPQVVAVKDQKSMFASLFS